MNSSKITIEIDGLRTRSLSNQREHWAAKAKRSKSEKGAAYQFLLARRHQIPCLMSITLTRIAPRQLDDDNLRGALKSVRDGVASALRVDDATPLIEWRYKQDFASKKYSVLIEIEVRCEETT